MDEMKKSHDAAARKAYLDRTVPVFTQLLEQAFAQAGLVKTKGMTTLIQELIMAEKTPSIERTVALVKDFGEFSRQAGLGPDPLRVRR